MASPTETDPEDGRKRILCPECDAEVATLPADGELEDPILCPNCGTELTFHDPLDPLDQAVEYVLRRVRG